MLCLNATPQMSLRTSALLTRVKQLRAEAVMSFYTPSIQDLAHSGHAAVVEINCFYSYCFLPKILLIFIYMSYPLLSLPISTL